MAYFKHNGHSALLSLFKRPEQARLPLTTYHSPLTTYLSLFTTHYSVLTTHYSPLTTHHSPLTTRHHLEQASGEAASHVFLTVVTRGDDEAQIQACKLLTEQGIIVLTKIVTGSRPSSTGSAVTPAGRLLAASALSYCLSRTSSKALRMLPATLTPRGHSYGSLLGEMRAGLGALFMPIVLHTSGRMRGEKAAAVAAEKAHQAVELAGSTLCCMWGLAQPLHQRGEPMPATQPLLLVLLRILRLALEGKRTPTETALVRPHATLLRTTALALVACIHFDMLPASPAPQPASTSGDPTASGLRPSPDQPSALPLHSSSPLFARGGSGGGGVTGSPGRVSPMGRRASARHASEIAREEAMGYENAKLEWRQANKEEAAAVSLQVVPPPRLASRTPPVRLLPRSCDLPGSCEPGSCEPGSCEPGSCEPGSCEPGSCEPGSCEPGSCEPGGCEPGSCEPGGCGTHAHACSCAAHAYTPPCAPALVARQAATRGHTARREVAISMEERTEIAISKKEGTEVASNAPVAVTTAVSLQPAAALPSQTRVQQAGAGAAKPPVEVGAAAMAQVGPYGLSMSITRRVEELAVQLMHRLETTLPRKPCGRCVQRDRREIDMRSP